MWVLRFIYRRDPAYIDIGDRIDFVGIQTILENLAIISIKVGITVVGKG